MGDGWLAMMIMVLAAVMFVLGLYGGADMMEKPCVEGRPFIIGKKVYVCEHKEVR